MRPSRAAYLEIRCREQENRRNYEAGSGISAPPHTICLTVNNRCAFRCKHCDIGTVNASKDASMIDQMYYSSRYRKYEDYSLFPLERLKELVDEMKPHGSIIKTNFVEPLMYPHLAEFIEYVKGAGLKYHTITNGWKLEDAAEWLVDLGADLVRVSIDGPPEIHDAVRGRPGSFERAIAGLEAMIARKRKHGAKKPITGICYTISDHTYEHIVQFMDTLNERGLLDDVYVNFNHLMYTVPWEIEETLKVQPDYTHMRRCSIDRVNLPKIDSNRLNALVNELYRKYPLDDYHYYFSPWLKDEDTADFYDPEKWMFKGTPCRLPWYAAQVEINGDLGVYGHCILPAFGNIMNNKFLDTWNSPAAIKARTDLHAVGSYAGCNRCIGTLYPLRGRE